MCIQFEWLKQCFQQPLFVWVIQRVILPFVVGTPKSHCKDSYQPTGTRANDLFGGESRTSLCFTQYKKVYIYIYV